MRTVAVALLLSGCVDVHVEAPLVCASARDVTFDNPIGALPGDFSDEVVGIDTEVVQEEVAGLPEGLSTAVVFFDGVLTPTSEADLSFVEKVRIHLGPQDETADLPDIDLFAFRRDPTDHASDIVVEGFGEAVDFAAYLSEGGAVFGFELSATASEFPEQVVFDAELCFSAALDFHQDLIPAP